MFGMVLKQGQGGIQVRLTQEQRRADYAPVLRVIYRDRVCNQIEEFRIA
jgi:hypothetical protein